MPSDARGHGAAGGHRCVRSAEGGPGVEDSGRSDRSEACSAGRAGGEVPGDVGHDVRRAGGAVVERDPSVSPDRQHGQVGDGVPGVEVDAGRRRSGPATRIPGEVSRRRRVGRDQRHHDSRDTRRRHGADAGHLGGDRRSRGHRGPGRADAHAGVEYARRRHRGEAPRSGRRGGCNHGSRRGSWWRDSWWRGLSRRSKAEADNHHGGGQTGKDSSGRVQRTDAGRRKRTTAKHRYLRWGAVTGATTSTERPRCVTVRAEPTEVRPITQEVEGLYVIRRDASHHSSHVDGSIVRGPAFVPTPLQPHRTKGQDPAQTQSLTLARVTEASEGLSAAFGG